MSKQTIDRAKAIAHTFQNGHRTDEYCLEEAKKYITNKDMEAEKVTPFNQEWYDYMFKMSKKDIINMFKDLAEDIAKTDTQHYQALSEICDMLEKDIPVPKFILALLQIRRIATKAINREIT